VHCREKEVVHNDGSDYVKSEDRDRRSSCGSTSQSIKPQH